MTIDLAGWIEAQAHHSAERMSLVVSATSLVKNRAGFAQTIRPAKGSVLAAPSIADTPPDYFFHWLRDSAVVMDAALALIRNGINADTWQQHFEDFVAFSLSLRDISGPRFLAEAGDFRKKMKPDFLQFVRPDEEITAINDDRVHGDVRYSADGQIDFIKWNRPQHDGPAARALVGMRAIEAHVSSGRKAEARLADLIRGDLDYTLAHAAAPCYDIWEEEFALHYYTILLQCAALELGSHWAANRGEFDYARCLGRASEELTTQLDAFWSEERGMFCSRIFPSGEVSPKDPDFAVLMGVLHAGLVDGPHSIRDARVFYALGGFGALFSAAFGVNTHRSNGFAYGRYNGDTYVGGGAWYPCTLGAAELYYQLGEVEAGDAIMAHVRENIPATGEISEQFDRDTGTQTSAQDLGWSYAAFITAWDARKTALANI
jgi:glucoamylase